MTLLNGTARLLGSITFLVTGAVCGVSVCIAAGTGHPDVAGVGCVTSACHARLLESASAAKGGSVHQPASGGECASCHDLALPAGARFVKGAPASGDEGAEGARAWDLALCAGCHGEALYARDAPAGTTGFSDGGRNLHAHHIQAGRGRRCLVCHEPHVARQPKLLRERIPARGNAKIPQVFRGEPKGGWCKTGCHAPKSYRR